MLSHWTAGVRWRLIRPVHGPVHVIAPRDRRTRRGICTHKARLHPHDRTKRDGIPITSVSRTLETNKRTKGSRALRVVIASVTPGTRRTRSDLEVAFLDLCRKYGIPKPKENAEVEGIEVGFHWPRARLIVELDSYEYHRTPAEFENDRRRDAYLKTRRYEVLRVPEGSLNSEPQEVAATVESLLSRLPE